MTPYPLLFRPILKPRVWGGRRLAHLGKPLPPGESIGESWEIADLPPQIEAGQSIIANGPLAGLALGVAIEAHTDMILGEARSRQKTASGRPPFPLLIKYLDARENLSVQVHPDRAYVERHSGTHVKDEAWVVIEHEPGAVIYKGLRAGLNAAALRERLSTGEVVNDLHAMEVKRGECHYLPSGTVHALGAGVLVAEVQTPSDTTFRMYDWGRTSRRLHIDESLEVLFGARDQSPEDFFPGPHPVPAPCVVGHVRTTHLLSAECFTIERIDVLEDGPFEIITGNQPEVWMVLEGEGKIGGDAIRETGGNEKGNGRAVRLVKGTTVLLPAAMPDSHAHLRSGAQLLRVTLPSPLRGLIA